MQVRYRYRLYPSPGQQQALARVFGCARVVYNDCLYVAKVGDIRVEWSRALPSVPSSVTVIKEADGRYHTSFVVERAATPLPACGQEVGIDLGLASLIVTSDGEVIANPRFLRAKERALARAQRGLSRTRRGSANRGRARHRVPTSQVCSACGAKDGPKPLQVRAWTCRACGTVHDRDVNAARNILAAGRADNKNACRAGIRPRPVAADAETGTHRSVA